MAIIEQHTREAGVRGLEREAEKLAFGGLLHELRPDRQCGGSTGSGMILAADGDHEVEADPHPDDQIGGEAHEPSIGGIVGGSRLARHGKSGDGGFRGRAPFLRHPPQGVRHFMTGP